MIKEIFKFILVCLAMPFILAWLLLFLIFCVFVLASHLISEEAVFKK